MRVRFYSEDGMYYVVLRADEHGITRLRERKKAMPAPKKVLAQSTHSDYSSVSEQGLAELLTRFIDDTEVTLDQEPEAILMIRKGYKKRGYQVSLKYRGEWSNVSRETLLIALFDYLKGEFD